MSKLTREEAKYLFNYANRYSQSQYDERIDKIFDQHEDETAGLVNTIDELYGRISAINEANVRLISKYEEEAKSLQNRIHELEKQLDVCHTTSKSLKRTGVGEYVTWDYGDKEKYIESLEEQLGGEVVAEFETSSIITNESVYDGCWLEIDCPKENAEDYNGNYKVTLIKQKGK